MENNRTSGKARSLQLAGHYVARCLLSSVKSGDQVFWNEKYALISNLSTIEAILGERSFFFGTNLSRSNGISLIVIIDLTWQICRSIAGIKGDDAKWAETHIPTPPNNLIGGTQDDADFFLCERDLIKDIQWVYEVHSATRHPDKLIEYPWIFYDPWPQEINDRLLRAADGLDAVLTVFSDPFTFGGWEDEIARKQKMMSIAAKAWNPPQKGKTS